MSHPTAWRRSLSCNKSNDRFCAIFFDPMCSFSFHSTSDFTDQNDSFSFLVIHQQLDRMLSRSTDNSVTTNSNGGCNTQSCFYGLIYCFVSQGSGFRNYANLTFFKDEARHNTNLCFFCGDDTRTVRADQTRVFVAQVRFYLNHIFSRNTFCNTNNQGYTCSCSFHNGIRSKCRWYKNDGNICSCFIYSFLYSIKYRTV